MQEEGEESMNRGFKNCEAFCNRLRRNYPQTYAQLVQLIREYQKSGQSIHHYHQEMKKLFNDQPTVIDDVNKLFYHDARIKTNDPLHALTQVFRNDPGKMRVLLETQNLIQKGQLDNQQQCDLFQIKFRDFPDALREIQNLFRVKKTKIQIDWADYKQQKRVKTEDEYLNFHYSQHFHLNSLQSNREVKNEIVLLDKIRTKIFSLFQSEEHFKNFFKEFIIVVHLFSECIITPQEFIDLCSQHFDNDLMDEIKVATYSRATARRQQTTLFKPLKDTDFKNAEHVTGSYVRMHPGYANIIRNVVPNVLNHLWVSVPFGSEDYSFSIMRKNSFEEQLFKIEDEMYEYDVNINCYKATIKLLSKIESSQSNGDATLRKIMQIKCLQSVYKTTSKDQEEVISLWHKNPITCSTILRERLQVKLNELIKSREIANQTWKLIQKNNFSRSLDHRSFYFKKNEKQYTCITKFLKEPEENYKVPQHEYLNSLAQLTTIKPLSHGITLHDTTAIFNLYLPNRSLIRETFEIFRYYASDNESVLKYLQMLCEGYFNEKFTTETYNFQHLRTQLLQVEQYLSNSAYLDAFTITIETENKKNVNNKEVSETSESDFELERLKSLDSPQTSEEEMYPQSKLQPGSEERGIIYGTQSMYIFIRYFYTLYQRLEIAQQVSFIFENCEKLNGLQQNEKDDVAGKKYRLFKLALLYSIKNKDFKYQDYLSILFGKQVMNNNDQAFLFFTIDKLLSDCCKYLSASDKITEPYLNFLFKFQDDRYQLDLTRTPDLQLANLTYALLDREQDKNDRVVFKVNGFLIQFELQEKSLHIYYLPSWSQITEKQQLSKIQQFVKQYTTTFPQRQYKVFLNRNLKETQKKINNELEWIFNDSLKIYKGNADIII